MNTSFRRDMLVAPVYEEGRHDWTLYLPEDEWIHLWTGKAYGGGEVTVSAELGYTPVFYRRGSSHEALFREIGEKYGVK